LKYGSVGKTVIYGSKRIEFKSLTSHQMQKKIQKLQKTKRNRIKNIRFIFFMQPTKKSIAHVEEIDYAKQESCINKM
jgi:hypothetical protein